MNETKEQRREDEQLEALLQRIPLEDRDRLRAEVAAALAGPEGATPPPDFVIRTELLRRLMQERGRRLEQPGGGVA